MNNTHHNKIKNTWMEDKEPAWFKNKNNEYVISNSTLNFCESYSILHNKNKKIKRSLPIKYNVLFTE